MADTREATLTFALPEDAESDFLQIWEATLEGSAYTQVGADIAYEYGDTTYEFNALDTAKWYKIKFRNNTDSTAGPFSDPVYGGDFDSKTKPFLAVSSTTDGANYASTSDVYAYTTLTSADVPATRVSSALRRARALIDLRTMAMDLDRFKYAFDTDVARRKYNAALRVVKEAEINFALSAIFRGLSDDKIMEGIRDEGADSSISIGSSSISTDTGLSGSQNATMLRRLELRYKQEAEELLDSLRKPSVILTHQEDGNRIPRNAGGFVFSKFLNPTNPWQR